jgi:hypothetical protein
MNQLWINTTPEEIGILNEDGGVDRIPPSKEFQIKCKNMPSGKLEIEGCRWTVKTRTFFEILENTSSSKKSFHEMPPNSIVFVSSEVGAVISGWNDQTFLQGRTYLGTIIDVDSVVRDSKGNIDYFKELILYQKPTLI